jgi:integrase
LALFLLSFLLSGMASLWRHPKSPFWVACFTVHVPDSLPQRWKRSLKTEDRRIAKSIADTLEDAGRGVLTEETINSFVEKIRDVKLRTAATKIFCDVFRSVAGREFGAGSLRAFAESWLTGLKVELALQSWDRYKQAIDGFVAFLGPAADRDLIGFGPRDDVLVIQFRDTLAARLAPASVNTALKIVKQMFKSASQRFKIESPARLVGGVKIRKGQAEARRAFTLPELGRILRVVRGSEWEGIILAGLYTGQRLGDIATLRWENVDLIQRELALTTRKTDRRVLVPLAAPLAEYLLRSPASDDPKDFVFQRAAECIRRSKTERAGTLSNQFHDILAGAGLVRRRSHRKAKDGAGRSARRRMSDISFHSLRHTATSLLKNAGVPQSVVMDIIGHESRAVSQIYTHVGEPEKKVAIAALPTIDALLQAAEADTRSKRNKEQKRQPAHLRGTKNQKRKEKG